jgi:hypothetical protein
MKAPEILKNDFFTSKDIKANSLLSLVKSSIPKGKDYLNPGLYVVGNIDATKLTQYLHDHSDGIFPAIHDDTTLDIDIVLAKNQANKPSFLVDVKYDNKTPFKIKDV